MILPSDLPRLAPGAIVALDTEGSGLAVDDGARISTVSVAYREGGGVVVHAWPFDQGPLEDKPGLVPKNDDARASMIAPGENSDPNLPDTEYRALIKWLSDKDLVLANAKHDLHQFRAGLRGREDRTQCDLSEQVRWDTMLASWILDPLDPVGLDASAKRELGLEGKDTATLKDALRRNARFGNGLLRRYDLIYWHEIESYAKVDAELTLKLYEHQQEEFEEQRTDLVHFMDEEMVIMKLLYRMEAKGLRYNKAKSLAAAKQLEQHLVEIQAELPFRHTAPAATKYFFGTSSEGEARALPHCLTDSGKPSAGECCIRSLASKQDEVGEVARTYQVAQKVKDSINRYYRGFPDQLGLDGRLRTNFRQTGTISFRFSSSRVNLQALPHDYRLDKLPDGIAMPRALFEDDEGCELWELDLAQAEYRVAGRLAGCKRILRYIEEERDAHSETADLLFGNHEFQSRQVAKRANFSLLFSIGPRKFNLDVEKQTGVKLGETKAREIINEWRALHPEIPVANRRAEEAMLARGRATGYGQGYVKLIDGRLRWLAWDEHSYKAFNQAVQGSIAQGVKKWMIAIDERWPGILRLQVHDSVAVMVDRNRVAEVVPEIQELGAKMLTDLYGVPMAVDAKRWKTANCE